MERVLSSVTSFTILFVYMLNKSVPTPHIADTNTRQVLASADASTLDIEVSEMATVNQQIGYQP